MFSALEAVKELEVVKSSTKKTLDLIPQVDAILKPFDGKVFNKKLSTAMQTIDPRVRAWRGDYTTSLVISIDGQRFHNYILRSKCLVTTNKGRTYHLDYAKAHKDLICQKDFLEKELEKIYFSINNYVEVIREIEEHKNRIRELHESLHWTVQL